MMAMPVLTTSRHSRHERLKLLASTEPKGRALTDRADWESEPFVEARSKRSAVESLMFTLKHGFHFGEVARRGLSAVYAELLEKALAYNLCVTTRLRHATIATSEAHAARLIFGAELPQKKTIPVGSGSRLKIGIVRSHFGHR